MLFKSNQSSHLRGIKVAPSAMVVNHLLFADYILFFKESNDQAMEASNLLDIYCNASGQRINKNHSFVIFIKGCQVFW
jgi:hypothetical protein